jgi:Tfp pilus assembly protein PilO
VTLRLFLVWAGGCVLGILAYRLMALVPLDRRLQALSRERAQLQEARRELDATAARLPALERESERLLHELTRVDAVLPAARHVEMARASLYRAASESRVEMVSVHVGSAEWLVGFAATALAVEARGGLIELAGFFDRLDRLKPMIQARSLVISRGARGYHARSSMEVFGYRPAAPASGAGG